MKALTLIIICFLINSIPLSAQNYTENIRSNTKYNDEVNPKDQSFVFNTMMPANKIKDDIENLNSSIVRSHFLGIEVAKRIHLFENQFTYRSKAAPGAFSGKKIIHKPVIYNSIYQIEKYFKKQVRKEKIDIQNAAYELCKYIELALFLLHEETSVFENALKDADSTEKIMKTLNDVEIRYN